MSSESSDPNLPPLPHPWLPPLIAIIGLIGLAGVFLVGYLPRVEKQARLSELIAVGSGPVRVRIVHPKIAPPASPLHLPASIEASRETGIYARANGFVSRWLVDLGTEVSAGQLLAEIDVPEVRQQLDQAHASTAQAAAGIAQAQASLALARINLERAKNLGPHITSQADIDTRQADADAASANLRLAEAKLASAEADERRLTELVGFSRITAPFTGTITRRNLEVGNLVTGGIGAPALFQLAQLDPIRVVVEVPQTLASGVEVGVAASISQRGLPGKLTATVSHLAKSLDPTTRTMRVEINVANKDHLLLPGMYADVTLAVPNRSQLMVIDSAALLQSASGTQVAIVAADNRIHLVSVVIAVDSGSELSISEGLTPDDRVVANPAGRIREGVAVEVVADPVTSGK
jgi:membrane fusion protein, multidrug efflux system